MAQTNRLDRESHAGTSHNKRKTWLCSDTGAIPKLQRTSEAQKSSLLRGAEGGDRLPEMVWEMVCRRQQALWLKGAFECDATGAAEKQNGHTKKRPGQYTVRAALSYGDWIKILDRVLKGRPVIDPQP